MIAELQRLKAGIEKAQSQYDMRKGQLQSVIDTLKEKGFSSIKELQDKIKELEAETEKRKAELETGVKEWKGAYEHLIG